MIELFGAWISPQHITCMKVRAVPGEVALSIYLVGGHVHVKIYMTAELGTDKAWEIALWDLDAARTLMKDAL